MLINGVDINTLGVKLYDRVLTSNEVDTTEDWLDGDFQPTYVRQQDRFKNIKLSFLVLENDEDTAFKIMSKLTALLKKATLMFDDIDCSFDVILNGSSSQQRLKNGKFVLTFNLKSDYGKGEEEIYTTDKSATEYFTLSIMYYSDTNTLLASERKSLRRMDFAETGNTFASIGIDLNKHRAEHYNPGIPTNFTGIELNYDNLSKLPALIINYEPTAYTIDVQHFKSNELGIYDLFATVKTTFTYPALLKISTIGELIDIKSYKPEGYIGKIQYNGPLTVEALLANSPITVYYDKPAVDRQKEVVISYAREVGENNYDSIGEKTVVIKESDLVEGSRLKDIIQLDAYKPAKYYDNGVLIGADINGLITFEDLLLSYSVRYNKTENKIFVEYYQGEYPNWYRLTSETIVSKVEDRYLEEGYKIDLKEDLGINKDSYLTEVYEPGVVVNEDIIISYDDVLNLGVVQIYYVPKEYAVDIRYFKDDKKGEPIGTDTITINDVMFLSGSITIGDIVDLNKYKPESYTLYDYYQGEMTLSAILSSAPLDIVYGPLVLEQEKNVVVRYKKEMSSAYSVIATETITIKESEVAGGVRLSTLLNIDKHLPEYYSSGIIDGHSLNQVVEFYDIKSEYSILYLAKQYQTNVRYYTDEVNDLNWIGSDLIKYRVIDFAVGTTLFDLGLDLNAFKPAYCADGVLQYTGPVSFEALMRLEAINVVYESIDEPGDPDITYPKRFLYIDYNDLKGNESLFPNETFNKAYINTGFTCLDKSKLTVIVEAEKVWANTDLTEVNVGDAYIFGSKSSGPDGEFAMKYRNNTRYLVPGQEQMTNTYTAVSGTRPVILDEASAVGFSRNTGIYSTERYGYSFATFTYTNTIPTDTTPVRYPIYLFANNNQGAYADGIAGVGIYGCKIYYDNELMRDLIPVAFYDKIGDQVAPSNCLYDKVSQTFFEDARGKNSFKIKDDPDWIPELSQKLGNCFVSYYKDGQLFRSATIWFRGDDFKEPWNMYENFFVDYYQPQYYGPGKIVEAPESGEGTFDSLNGKSFTVRYESLGYNVVANYYRDSIAEENLIASDQLTFEERDFYSNPSFGDLIKINKYKPDGYQTDFKYTDKVVLNQIIANAPYNIVYKPATDIKEYSFNVKYYQQLKGDRKYLGSLESKIDSTQFQDGVYVEDFIAFDAMKPLYCESGEPLDFYLQDEPLINEEGLRAEYSIIYKSAPQNIELRYYTDVVEEDNQIATKNWQIKEEMWLADEPIILQEAIPYPIVNAYKPEICLAGVVQGELTYFADLVVKGYVDIVYTTIKEPTDPEGYSFPKKILYFENAKDSLDLDYDIPYQPREGARFVESRRPWIDTGFKPRDLNRLSMEVKTYALAEGLDTIARNNTYSTSDYAYYLGYYGALPEYNWEKYSIPYMSQMAGGSFPRYIPSREHFMRNASIASTGCCAVRAHSPFGTSYVPKASGPQSLDGYPFFLPETNVMGQGAKENVSSVLGVWRKGLINQQMNNDNIDQKTGKKVSVVNSIKQIEDKKNVGRDSINQPEMSSWQYKPFTIGLSPYKNELYSYNYSNLRDKKVVNVSEEDLDIQEENRFLPCRPVDTLTVFASRNPDTGKINLPTTSFYTNPEIVGFGDKWGDDVVEQEITVITGKDEAGNPILDTVTIKLQNYFKNFPVYSNPGVDKAYIWEIKIWDKDKLVRHMIPVEQGQVIYDSYVAPSNCLFDIITETFFGNQNKGGTYISEWDGNVYQVEAKDVLPLQIKDDISTLGNITINYYKDGTEFIGNKKVAIPYLYSAEQTNYEEIFHLNDMNPDVRYYNKGRSDYGGLWIENPENPLPLPSLEDIMALGYINVFYDPIMFESTVSIYEEDTFRGYKPFRFTVKELEKATKIEDLNIFPDGYVDNDYQTGKFVFDNTAFTEKRYDEIISLPSIPFILEKRTDADNFYLEYFRHSASLEYTRDYTKNHIECDLIYKVMAVEGTDGYDKHNLYVGNPQIVAHYDYKQSVHIVKLTSDKTWGYDSERNAWLELKYLTTKQESKYLRGLAVDIVRLDEIDWEKTYVDFAGLGVDIQKWKLAYHADAINEYQGAFTLEALKTANSIELVYPETIYNYNCLYYKDTLKTTSVPIATEPFAFTIGDFDLDWVKFINTNEQYLKGLYIKLTKNTVGRKEPGVQYEKVQDLLKGNWYDVVRTNDNEDWYFVREPISKEWLWIPKADTEKYTPTPSLAGIGKTWSDIGIDTNKHKPEGYGDGIAIWNAVQFQETKDQVINLEDLIVSGGQKVLYPVKTGKYKALYTHSFTEFPLDNLNCKEYSYQVRAEHLTTSQNTLGNRAGTWFYGNSKPEENGFMVIAQQYNQYRQYPAIFFDYEYLISTNTVNKYKGRKPFNDKLSVQPYNVVSGSYTNNYEPSQMLFAPQVNIFAEYDKSFDRAYYVEPVNTDLRTMRLVLNHYENNSLTAIKTYQQGLKGKYGDYIQELFYDREDYVFENQYLPSGFVDKASGTVNGVRVIDKVYIGSGIVSGLIDRYENSITDISDGNRMVVKEYKAFEGKNLKHWFIPLPKGHPIAGGKMPQTGFYDLITGATTNYVAHKQKIDINSSVNGDYKILKDDFVKVPPSDPNKEEVWTSFPDLYYYDANVETDKPLDYFGEQIYNTEEVFYPVVSTESVNAYKYPDEYADLLATYPAGQVMPITRRLKDETWSYNGYGWIKSEALSRETVYTIAEPQVNKVAIKGDTTSGAWALKLEPLAEAPMNQNIADYEAIINVSAISGDFLWIDKGWLDFRGTDLYFNEINKKVITSEGVACYEYPTLQAKTVKTYILGTQLNLTKELVRDNIWAHTGEGWIRTDKTVEIMEKGE